MFEAKLIQGALLKKIVEAVRELVTDANLDCSESGISMQAMDSSHVSLCAMLIRSDGFDHYRCDRNLSIGLSMANISKILKCAGNTDKVTLKAEDKPDILTLMFESESESRPHDLPSAPWPGPTSPGCVVLWRWLCCRFFFSLCVQHQSVIPGIAHHHHIRYFLNIPGFRWIFGATLYGSTIDEGWRGGSGWSPANRVQQV